MAELMYANPYEILKDCCAYVEYRGAKTVLVSDVSLAHE